MASFSSSSSSSSLTSWSLNAQVSRDEFNLFHTIDRELYALLVINLFRDPAESMQVIALWLWLERKGCKHIVKTMLSLPHFLVNELADEAVSCLGLISAARGSLSRTEIPLTQSLLEKDHAGLVALLRSHRLSVAREVTAIVNEVCVRAMGDVLRQAATAAAAAAAAASAASSGGAEVVPADDRTMFVTFSKGYPVFEWEVREFFTRAYGETCIESLHMQEVPENEQSLFARIVFMTGSTIDAILNGLTKAKFTINGKHVWMRKFVPKRPKSTPAPPMVLQPPHHTTPQEHHHLHHHQLVVPSFPESLFE